MTRSQQMAVALLMRVAAQSTINLGLLWHSILFAAQTTDQGQRLVKGGMSLLSRLSAG